MDITSSIKKFVNEVKQNSLRVAIERAAFEVVKKARKTNENNGGNELAFSTYLSRLKAQRIANILEEKGVGKSIINSNLREKKGSDTLFVLGSGTSINNISTDKWNEISKYDSIGINKWPVHDHVPTYLVFELPWAEDMEYVKDYVDMLNKKGSLYKDVVKIKKGFSFSSLKHIKPQIIPNWITKDLVLACDSGFNNVVDWNTDASENAKLLEYLEQNGIFDEGYLGVQYKKRGTVSFVVGLAVILGYDNIVLCGVDMNNSKYFFDHQKYDNVGTIPRLDKKPDSKVHKTVDKSVGSLTLDIVIKQMYEKVCKKKGVKVYVESDSSRLHPHFPKFRGEG